MNRRSGQLPVALCLTFLSGATGLAHQVLWTRRMVDILGASAGTFSKVIGAFFIGLAIGAWLASRPHPPRTRCWRRVARAELLVALLALPLALSSSLTGWLSDPSVNAGLLQWLLPLLLVAPPAIAMGLVLPWLLRALARQSGWDSRHAVWLYAVNTLGGVAGIATVLIAGLPGLGLDGASWAAISVNVFLAAIALSMRDSRNVGAEDPDNTGEDTSTPATSQALPRWLIHLVALASGALVLALEVVLQHQFSQVAINSLFSSATVLTLVLLALTAGAFAAPVLVGITGNLRRALIIALIAAAGTCALQPFLLTSLRRGLVILPYALPPLEYFREIVELGLLSIAPAFFAAGLVFPLLLRNVAASEGARRTGALLAWNGLGGWLGAELCQGLLAPAAGLWLSVQIVAALYFCLAVIIAFSRRRSDNAATSSFMLHPAAKASAWIVLGAGLIFATLQSRRLPQASVGHGERLHAFQVGREGAVATLECGPGDWRMLFNNSYTLGGSRAQFNQERQALLPLLLHGNARSAALLGVATGSTVAGAALQPGLERIDAVELSPLVLEYARTYFEPFNRRVFHDPRVRFLSEDARWVMTRERAAYDVVVGDLFLPWRTGEGRLFTIEHFQNVQRALKPDGLFCQWLPLFQLTRPQVDAILRTFQRVFPDAFLIRGDFYSELPILGLVGGRSFNSLDWANIETGCTALRARSVTRDPLVRHREGVAMMLLGPMPAPVPGPVNSLANAWLEWDAGRNIIGLSKPWFIGVPWAEFARDVQRAGTPMLPEPLRAAHDSGQFLLTLDIVARQNLPHLPEMKSQMPARLPKALLSDNSAAWEHWPMRLKPEPPPPGG